MRCVGGEGVRGEDVWEHVVHVCIGRRMVMTSEGVGRGGSG